MPAATAEKVMDKKEVAYQIRCSRAMMDRMEYAAGQLGLSVAAWLRMLAMKDMAEHSIPETPPKEPKKPRR